MTKLNNILWVVIDSVRSYSGTGDSRDLLPIMEQISTQAVRYLNVQTSAPSTIMSTSAMMSGLDSIYHALTYQGFDSTQNGINYISNNLRMRGYNIYFITFFPEGFLALSPLFGDLTSDFSAINIPKNRFWTNSEINLVLEDLIAQNQIKEPFFFYLNYNCRNDPDTSNQVEKGMDLIFKAVSKDHTYLIVNSDHGYPDPSKQLQSKMHLLGHDIVMTEDNITVPLIIQGPLFDKNHMVETRVSLLDVAELVNSVADGNLDTSKLYNIASGFPSIDNVYFTWNRYPAQFGGLVSATFKSFKLVYSLDHLTHEWYILSSKMSDNNQWSIGEKSIGEDSVTENIKSYILDTTQQEIENVVIHYSHQLSESLFSILSTYPSRPLSIICSPTNLYCDIVIKATKQIGYVAYKLDDFIPGRVLFVIDNKIQLDQNKTRRHLNIYIPPGVSPLKFFIDVYRLLKCGRYPSFVTDFNLKNIQPPYIYIYRLIRSSANQLGKSYRAHGLRKTIAIIINSLR